jgi:hypothetical protein
MQFNGINRDPVLGRFACAIMLNWTCWTTHIAVAAPDSSPLLDKYTSAEQVAAEIAQLESQHPGVIQEVLADFDLAIRASLTCELPPTKAAQRSHTFVGEEVGSGCVRTREHLDRVLYKLRNRPDDFALTELERIARIKYYEEHFEELVLEGNPYLGLVMMHVLANGWQDWSAWEPGNERLSKARQKFPDLHRINALNTLVVLRHTPAVGLLLRIVSDANDPLSGHANAALRDIGNYDALRFYIDWAVDAPNTAVGGEPIWAAIHALAQRMPGEQVDEAKARAFWEPYLDSDVPMLWYFAQQAFGRPLENKDLTWVREAQADWNYEHERDPNIRRAIELRREMAAIHQQADPETNRFSTQQLEEFQKLQAELDQLERKNGNGKSQNKQANTP